MFARNRLTKKKLVELERKIKISHRVTPDSVDRCSKDSEETGR